MKSAEQKNIHTKLKHKHSFNGDNDSKKIDGRKGKRATEMCEFCNEVYANMFFPTQTQIHKEIQALKRAKQTKGVDIRMQNSMVNIA